MPFNADDARSLPGLTFAFDRAYAACPPHVRALPSRHQSPEILRLAAMACTMVRLHELRDDGEAQTVAHLAALARDPVQLEAFIAAAHAACRDDDFPAARLDPLARRGFCPLEQKVRYPRRSAWQRLTELVADLRVGTEGLDDEALVIALRDNIRSIPSSYAVPDVPGFDAKAHDRMPVTVAACYLLAFERGHCELERCIEACDRHIRGLENRICELEAQCEARACRETP
jgi:hypothetical protein